MDIWVSSTFWLMWICCYEHGCTNVCLSSSFQFFGVCTQKWTCRILQQLVGQILNPVSMDPRWRLSKDGYEPEFMCGFMSTDGYEPMNPSPCVGLWALSWAKGVYCFYGFQRGSQSQTVKLRRWRKEHDAVRHATESWCQPCCCPWWLSEPAQLLTTSSLSCSPEFEASWRELALRWPPTSHSAHRDWGVAPWSFPNCHGTYSAAAYYLFHGAQALQTKRKLLIQTSKKYSEGFLFSFPI